MVRSCLQCIAKISTLRVDVGALVEQRLDYLVVASPEAACSALP
jgi:hypothetical protein